MIVASLRQFRRGTLISSLWLLLLFLLYAFSFMIFSVFCMLSLKYQKLNLEFLLCSIKNQKHERLNFPFALLETLSSCMRACAYTPLQVELLSSHSSPTGRSRWKAWRISRVILFTSLDGKKHIRKLLIHVTSSTKERKRSFAWDLGPCFLQPKLEYTGVKGVVYQRAVDR